MQPRILYVVNSADFFLSHRLPIALAARASGYDVHVATPDSPAVDAIRAHGFEHHAFPLGRRTVTPWGELRSLLALRALYRRIGPTLVHHVALKAVLYGTAAARLTGVTAVVNAVTGLGYLFCQSGVRGWFLRTVALSVFRVVMRGFHVTFIFQNPDDRKEFLDAGIVEDSRSVLIRGSGVELARYAATREPAGTPIVLFASRMLWDKGVGTFVRAAALLRARGVVARFVLAGDTDEDNPRAVSPDQLRGWHDSGAIEWWGHRTDMPDVFARSCVVVLPSTYREGVPKVLIEAAACGRPIVTTDMPGCREIVRNGSNGLLVAPNDAVGVADALERLLGSADLRKAMGEAGRVLVQREFTVQTVVHSTLQLYERVLPRPPSDTHARLTA